MSSPLVLNRLERRLIVGSGTLTDKQTRSSTLEVGRRDQGRIDGQLVVVDAETVALSVRVREHAGLEYRVGRSFDSGDQVRGREGDLLNLSCGGVNNDSRIMSASDGLQGRNKYRLTKVVLHVGIQDELAHGAKRELTVGPNLGQVENVVLELLSLGDGHRLHAQSPRGEVSRINSLKEILLGIVGVAAGELSCLFRRQEFDPLIRSPVELSCLCQQAIHVYRQP